jgi:hypothetical protein
MRSVFPNGDTAVMALDDGEAAADSDSPYAPSAREGSERTDVTSRTVPALSSPPKYTGSPVSRKAPERGMAKFCRSIKPRTLPHL